MTRREANERVSSVGVLNKANQVLGYLEKHPEAGPTGVAEALGMNKSTAFRLLSALAQIGLLDNDPERGTYRLGLRLLELGHKVQDRLDLRRIALPHLRELAQKTGLTTFVCVRRGQDVVCLDRVAAGQVDVLELQPGGRLPLHVGGAGKAILASLPDEEVEEYLATADLVALTERSIVDPASLREELRRTRARGYSESWEDVTVGIAALGAAVTDVRGEVAGAISVSGLAVMVGGPNHGELVQALITTAKNISRQLGGKGD